MNTKSNLLKDTYPYNLVYDLLTNKGGWLKNKPIVLSDIDSKVINTDMDLLNSIMNRLPYRERYMLSLRYVDKKTYREIGEIHNITPCRVQQIIDKTLRRIRITMMRDMREMNHDV